MIVIVSILGVSIIVMVAYLVLSNRRPNVTNVTVLPPSRTKGWKGVAERATEQIAVNALNPSLYIDALVPG